MYETKTVKVQELDFPVECVCLCENQWGVLEMGDIIFHLGAS